MIRPSRHLRQTGIDIYELFIHNYMGYSSALVESNQSTHPSVLIFFPTIPPSKPRHAPKPDPGGVISPSNPKEDD